MQRGETRLEYTSFKWEFPGGKVEKGETPEQALKREIMEEMNMMVNVKQHLITIVHEYPDFIITMATYLCVPEMGRDFTMNEHHDFKWLKPSELHKLDWAEADRKTLSGPLDHLPHNGEGWRGDD